MLRLQVLVVLLLSLRTAAGMEQVSIPSLDGRLQLPGYLFEALVPGPRPAVISLHGCGGLLDAKGGLSRNRHRVAEYLNVEGMHMLAVDSFTPRGVKSLCETAVRQRSMDLEDRREDVFAAIRWLAQRPNVDRERIALIGYSNGGGTVLSVLDRTDRMVQGQPIQPRSAIAYYPPCRQFVEMWSYEIAAPLLLMIGALDEWTAPHYCERLHGKVKRAQPGASFEFILYPDSHHGFDGYGPVQVRTGLPTRTGTARIGANPQARDSSLRRTFDFLSAKLEVPLTLTHEARFNAHRYVVPAASGFASVGEVAAVPLSEKGRARYEEWLKLGAPKAFAISWKGGWYSASDDVEAMQGVLRRCADAGSHCWLYAVDDRVLWSRDPAARIGAPALQRNAPATRSMTGPRLH